VKTVWVATNFIGLALLIALGSPRAYAQFEVDPDHYDIGQPEPVQPAKAAPPVQAAKIHYQGNFTLPYTLQCKGRQLPPGHYAVSLDSDGRTAQVALNRKGQAVKIQGIAQRQNHQSMRDALLVQRSKGLYQLSLIHVAQWDLVFDPWLANPSDGKPRSFERVTLRPADSRN
jgi:hypothetical protein